MQNISSYYSTTKKQTTEFKKWAKDLNRHFSKVDNIDGQQGHENQNHKEKPLVIHWVGRNKKKIGTKQCW